jgi:hypothetical protein
MAKEKSRQEQAIGVIEEYLTAAEMCIKTTKADGRILGYPAVLLLLSATDAIGHGVLPYNQDKTRLDVLATKHFGSALTSSQATQVTNWYRHLLAHTGTMMTDVYLVPDAQGEAFDFDDSGAPVLIRVGKLHEIVSRAWTQVDKTAFSPRSPHPNAPHPNPADLPPHLLSALTSTASGVTSPGSGQGGQP